MVTTRIGRKPNNGIDSVALLGLASVILFFIGSAVVSYLNARTLHRNNAAIIRTHEVIVQLNEAFSAMKDAETGQRGYVITGDERYLTPYTTARNSLDTRLHQIERLVSDNPAHSARLPALKAEMGAKFTELEETIELRRNQGFDATREVVRSDRGKQSMDAIRTLIGEMQQEERRIRSQRLSEMESAYAIAVASGTVSGILGVGLSIIVAVLIRRAMLTRWHQSWLLSGQSGLSQRMVGDQRVEQLGAGILSYLAEYLDAHAGALFVREAGRFRRVATYGVPAASGTPESFTMGDGLLAQAATDRRTIIARDVPGEYLTIGSALGSGRPRDLIITPIVADDEVNAVMELGFIHSLRDSTTELLDRMSEPIAAAVRSANFRAHLQNLLEETQRQGEELQAQGEELRVSNEELEEQSRALRESQSRLELQQAELEQTNTQLEEHAQLLESQRDELARTKAALESEAKNLERASQYKSDFLANMSHELRTPLNSSLILAKLLADNATGNLTDEQVEFARTIESAGNDLLNLINDILDLSKIEAGRMEVRPESVRLDRFVAGLVRTFRPIADEKGLAFNTVIAADSPESFQTDRHRFEQVVKNLLSNAFKFTERGEVELSVGRPEPGRIAFAVRDTGIGIADEKKGAIFEAFRQADSTTSRRYGGTGLGLSISRELTRILGGTIDLTSIEREGSTFTVTIPDVYDARAVHAYVARAPSSLSQPLPVSTSEPQKSDGPMRVLPRPIGDRQTAPGPDRRTILVVEDDESFAKVLSGLCEELSFHCLVASTVDDAWSLASEYLPSAVLLDVGLPDHFGLSLLDRLKHESRTRHIPVHVVSASDYTETALSLGAVGYMLKPVKRDELVQALNRIGAKLDQQLRRLLIVEDDPVQLASLGQLLQSPEVEIQGARSAAECLAFLRESTFDCMVLDLSLPDGSGYSILETLSEEDAYSFPPVIVYTGRDLSADEEQRLRRYSHSIIIKGAKSPERLLDEVTLFLHQVVSELPTEQQRMLEKARNRDAALENRRILIVEDDVRNVFALTSLLERRGAAVQVARNGREALDALTRAKAPPTGPIDLVLMDVMMPEMDGITATREIRKNPEWKKLPVIMLTAKAMKEDQEQCLNAGANDYMAKPLDADKLLSLIRVWMPR